MRAVMKMASLLTITVFLLCCSVVATKGSSENCEIYAVTGGTATLPLNVKLDNVLIWKLRDEKVFHQIGNKVITQKANATVGGSLVLNNLTKSDAGPYKYEIFDKERKLKAELRMHLCVLDPVKKPRVETECFEEQVNFTCIVDQQGVSYLWYKNDKWLEVEEGVSLIKVAKDVQSDSFYCNVSNQVSSERSDNVFIPRTERCLQSIIPNTLKVLPKALPSAVPKGSDITLSCNVSREPTHPTNLSVTWSVKNGATSEEILTFGPQGEVVAGTDFTQRYADGDIRLASSRNGVFELVISKVKTSDGGTYECSGKEGMRESGGKWIKIRESTKEFGTLTITPAGFPDSIFGISIWIFIGGGGGLLLLLIIIITVCCIRCRRKRRRRPYAGTKNFNETPV